MARRTEEAYVGWIRRFILANGKRHPKFMGAREVEVLRLLVRGASNAQIAARLVISSHTAKHHVSRVLAKLGAASRSEASAKGRDLLP